MGGSDIWLNLVFPQTVAEEIKYSLLKSIQTDPQLCLLKKRSDLRTVISKRRKGNLFPNTSSPITNANLSSHIKKQITDAKTTDDS